jgi:hypothetical protein
MSHTKLHSYVDILKIEKFQTSLRTMLKFENAFDFIMNFLE